MTRDQILYVAQNHWLYDMASPHEELAGWLIEFAKVIAAHEREACAKVVEESNLPDLYSEPALLDISAAIRARSKQ
jgi:hypothetical protein